MRIAVVVIARNEQATIAGCLESSRVALEAAGGGEILLVDAGSTDQTAQIARSMPGVRVLHVRNQPFHAAVARNFGLRAANADIVQFLDGDMLMERDWLVRARAALRSSSVAAVDGWLQERRLKEQPWNATFGLDWPMDQGDVARMGGAAAWRRESIEALGGFDEDLPLGEDPDLSLRARAEGMRLVRLPVWMASHDLDLRSLRDWWRRAVAVGRSRRLVASRHRVARAPLRRIFAEAAITTTCLIASILWLPLAAAIGGLGVARIVRFIRRGLEHGHDLRTSAIHAVHLAAVPVPVALGALASRPRIHRSITSEVAA